MRWNKKRPRRATEALITATASLIVPEQPILKTPTIRFRPAYSGGICNLNQEVWELPTVFDLAGIETADQEIPIVREHDPSKKIGQTTRIDYLPDRIDADGVLLFAGLEREADKVIEEWRRGWRPQASIRTGLIRPEYIEEIPTGQTVIVNGQPFIGPIFVARRFRLREISVVMVGADDETSVSIEASIGKPRKEKKMPFNLKGWLQKKGVKKSEIMRAAAAALEDEEQKTAAAADEEFQDWLVERAIDASATGEPELEALRKVFDYEMAAEEPIPKEDKKEGEAEDDPNQTPPEKKEGEAEDAPNQTPPEKKEGEAEDAPNQTSPEKKEGCASFGHYSRRSSRSRMLSAELAGRKNRSYYGPSVSSGGPHQCRVAEAAIMAHGGVSGDALKKVGFTEREIDAALSGDNQRLTPKRLIWRSGLASAMDTDQTSAISEIFQAGLLEARMKRLRSGQYREAAAAGNLSNIDIPNVMANVMHKSLLVGMQMIEDPTDQLCKVANAEDKRPQLFYLLNLKGEFDLVKDNGELSNLEYRDQGYWNQAQTRGCEMRISFDDIVNDNYGALTDTPTAVGRKVRIAKQRLFWQALGTVIGSGTGKVPAITGNPELSIDGLNSAFKKIRELKDDDRDPLLVRPKFVLVPPNLEGTAVDLQSSSTIIAGAGSTNKGIVPNNNRFVNKFETIASEFIGADGWISNWTDSSWMLLGDPLDLPAIIVSYLHGAKEPTLKTINGDYEIEGIRIGCWWTFGYSTADVRAGAFSNGSKS